MTDATTAPTPTPTPTPTPSVPGWAVWTLRLSALLFAVLVLLQAVLAALFVTGDVGLLEAHGINAGLVTTVAFLQVVAAILVWRPGRGAVWPIWGSAAAFLLVEAQLAFGYARLLIFHIPMGAALFGVATGLLVGACSPRIRQVRARPVTGQR